MKQKSIKKLYRFTVFFIVYITPMYNYDLFSSPIFLFSLPRKNYSLQTFINNTRFWNSITNIYNGRYLNILPPFSSKSRLKKVYRNTYFPDISSSSKFQACYHQFANVKYTFFELLKLYLFRKQDTFFYLSNPFVIDTNFFQHSILGTAKPLHSVY